MLHAMTCQFIAKIQVVANQNVLVIQVRDPPRAITQMWIKPHHNNKAILSNQITRSHQSLADTPVNQSRRFDSRYPHNNLSVGEQNQGRPD